jgi:hypothetical protein
MIPPDNAPPSPLSTVLGQIAIDVPNATADGTDIKIGKEYLEWFGAGNAGPRVIFVQHRKGRVGPPLEMGDACSFSMGCDMAVRAPETGSDFDRFAGVEILLARMCAWVAVACGGRVEWGDLADDSPLTVDVIGAGLAASFTYTYAVPHDARRWALPPATLDTSAQTSPTAPQAVPGAEPPTIIVSTEGQAPT